MMTKERDGSLHLSPSDEKKRIKIERMSRIHILRYIAELTDEMARLASDHKCVNLAYELADVAEKARREMGGRLQ
ncbi:MAG: hypothetical protein AAGB04_06195 [Pseudomonadota bacterium]